MKTGITSGVVAMNDLPGRRNRKSFQILAMPEVQEAIERVRGGVPTGSAVYVKFDRNTITKLRITTSSRILADVFNQLIGEEKLMSSAGKPLTALRYKASDGAEVVAVAESFPTYVRASSRRRVIMRHRGGK